MKATLTILLLMLVCTVALFATTCSAAEAEPLPVEQDKVKESNQDGDDDHGDEDCYAPSMEYGKPCNSSTRLLGDQLHTKIDYHIDVKGNTAVFCYGLGLGNCLAPVKCKWGYHFLGMANTGTFSLIWGKNKDTPSIKCKGIPFESDLEWSWTSGSCSHACSTE